MVIPLLYSVSDFSECQIIIHHQLNHMISDNSNSEISFFLVHETLPKTVIFMSTCFSRGFAWISLKRKCHHFDESFITGCTESCHFDNFRCSQWWRFHQNEDIFVSVMMCAYHDNVIKWKHFPRYWPFVWGIHLSPVNAPHTGQWRGALMGFFYLCLEYTVEWTIVKTGDLRRHRAHYGVIVMWCCRNPNFEPLWWPPWGQVT